MVTYTSFEEYYKTAHFPRWQRTARMLKDDQGSPVGIQFNLLLPFVGPVIIWMLNDKRSEERISNLLYVGLFAASLLIPALTSLYSYMITARAPLLKRDQEYSIYRPHIYLLVGFVGECLLCFLIHLWFDDICANRLFIVYLVHRVAH